MGFLSQMCLFCTIGLILYTFCVCDSIMFERLASTCIPSKSLRGIAAEVWHFYSWAFPINQETLASRFFNMKQRMLGLYVFVCLFVSLSLCERCFSLSVCECVYVACLCVCVCWESGHSFFILRYYFQMGFVSD